MQNVLEQDPHFWCWFYKTQFSYHYVHSVHAKMFSIQMLLHFSQIARRVCTLVFFINPRRACAARVTVVVCVCLSAPFQPLRVKVSPENDINASSRQDKENKTGDFLKNAPFKSYGVICSLCRRSAVL